MKKKFNVLIVVIPLIGCLIWMVITITFGPYPYWQYWFKQQQLADELNVNINDFPAPYTFPEGYFATILTSEMNIEAVHKKVLGYEKVFQCGESEVYYYFSENREDALIFKIYYDASSFDNERKFLSLISQENQNLIKVHDCIPGPINE